MIGSLIAVLSPILADVLKRAIPDATERAKVQAEITEQMLANEQAVFDGMKSVMGADAASENKMLSSARPIVVYWSLTLITFIAIMGSMGMADGLITALEKVPSGLWQFVTVGIGAFTLTRGIEKTVRELKK